MSTHTPAVLARGDGTFHAYCTCGCGWWAKRAHTNRDFAVETGRIHVEQDNPRTLAWYAAGCPPTRVSL